MDEPRRWLTLRPRGFFDWMGAIGNCGAAHVVEYLRTGVVQV